ncbi:hypothetical protein HAP94_08405 [Acidithiobacillus ferrivorans]|nr:hypothetical protein [Acidithiobacillus ferrivorans]
MDADTKPWNKIQADFMERHGLTDEQVAKAGEDIKREAGRQAKKPESKER